MYKYYVLKEIFLFLLSYWQYLAWMVVDKGDMPVTKTKDKLS